MKRRNETYMEKQKEIPQGYLLLAGVLKEGKENAMTSREIARRLGWREDVRNVLHVVEQLVTHYGYLIGSNRKGENKGYYLISNYEEYQETMRTYNSQIQSMLNRQRKLQENYIKRDQIEADLNPVTAQ